MPKPFTKKDAKFGKPNKPNGKPDFSKFKKKAKHESMASMSAGQIVEAMLL